MPQHDQPTSPTGPPTQQPTAPPTRPTGTPDAALAQTSGMSIASLVLGVAGIATGITAVAGVILGIIALRQIRRSHGRRRGRGIAIAGICVSCATFLVFTGYVALMSLAMIPAFKFAHRGAQSERALAEARLLAKDIIQYQADYNDAFPPPGTWQNALVSSSPDSTANSSASRFAMNAALNGMYTADIRFPARTVVLFEVSIESPSAGKRSLLPEEPLGVAGYVILFADGHVDRIDPEAIDELIWDPQAPPETEHAPQP